MANRGGRHTGNLQPNVSHGSSGSLNGSDRNSHKNYGFKSQTSLQRSSSRDNVRKIVEKEGKAARNLLTWSVPAQEQDHSDKENKDGGWQSQSQKHMRCSRVSQSHDQSLAVYSDLPLQSEQGKDCSKTKDDRPPVASWTYSFVDHIVSAEPPAEASGPGVDSFSYANGVQLAAAKPRMRRETKSEEYKERIRRAIEASSERNVPGSRASSAQAIQCQKALRCRYWSYLFDNLHRAVDEIYSTCDSDESIIECQEVIMMLDVCKRDFQELINRIKVFSQLENSDASKRPQSLAWEVRKQMSPGKCPSPTAALARHHSPSPAAVKFLNFGSAKQGFSWADRVRGFSKELTEDESNRKLESSSNVEAKSPLTASTRPPAPFFDTSSSPNKPNMPTPVVEASRHVECVDAGDLDDGGWEVVTNSRVRARPVTGDVTKPFHGVSPSVCSEKNRQQCGKTQPDLTAWEAFLPDAALNGSTEAVATSGTADTASGTADATIGASDATIGASDALIEIVRSPSGHWSSSDSAVERDCLLSQVDNHRASETYLDVSPTECERKVPAGDSDGQCEYDKDLVFELIDDEMSKITEEQEKALLCAIEEEQTLTKALEDEALKDDDQDEELSSERDLVAIDDGRETPKDFSDDILDCSVSIDDAEHAMTWEEMCAKYDREDAAHSWADQMEMNDRGRPPGRMLEMHQKFSSPSRKKPRSESVKINQEKMARAERRRLRILEDKCQRLKSLSEKVRKVRELKNQLIHEKERHILGSMRKAEENRKLMLQEKIKKAQEEEAKVNEIAFINCLEAQNKKIEVQEKHQVSEARLQDLFEERQRRREDKQAKEEAAQERRRQLEQERLARLQEIKQKRGDQAAKWEKDRVERERKREEAARERQREREMKLAARNEAQQLAAEELQRKIEQKQMESTKRHEQRIEEVKERAASSSRHSTIEETPSSVQYEKLKICTLCNVQIASDVYMVSHLKGKAHRAAVKDVNKKVTDAEMDAFSSKFIKDCEDLKSQREKESEERARALKKRVKKLKSRMAVKGKEYEATIQLHANVVESVHKSRLQKAAKELNKLLQSHTAGAWPDNKVAQFDKSLSEIVRSLKDECLNDQKAFCQIGGLAVLSRLLLLHEIGVERTGRRSLMPVKLLCRATEAIRLACHGCAENCRYMLLGNKLTILVDLLAAWLSVLDGSDSAVENDPSSAASKQNVSVEVKRGSCDGNSIVQNVLLEKFKDDPYASLVTQTIIVILRGFLPVCSSVKVRKDDQLGAEMQQRTIDIAAYIVCTGIPDRLLKLYRFVQGAPEDPASAGAVALAVRFLHSLCCCVLRYDSVFVSKKDDLTLISQTMKATEAFGLVSLMYSLLHQGSCVRISPSPLPLSDSTISILLAVLQTLNSLAVFALHDFQATLASDGAALQYRSVASFILRYASAERKDDLLHELILNIGYYVVQNEENQMFVQAGRAPSLLQQLCTLPFAYFSDPRLKTILFPTLICCCYSSADNTRALELEVSPTLLAMYLEEKLAESKSEPARSGDDLLLRSSLDLRFPRGLWLEARSYFMESSPAEDTAPVSS